MKKYSEEFKMADQNEDGKLDVEELFDLHNMVWMKHWIAPQAFFALKAQDHITFMDTNHDGGVDWTEFSTFMTPHIKEAIEEGNLPDGIDVIKDPTFDDRMNDNLKRFKHLFNEADLNKDGQL